MKRDKDTDWLARSRARRSLKPAIARAVRTEARVSQAELGRAVGVASSTISRWEQGERRPRGPLAERYANALQTLEAEVREGS